MPAGLSKTIKDKRALLIIAFLLNATILSRHHETIQGFQFHRVKQVIPKLPGPASNRDAFSACSPAGEAAMHGMTSHMSLGLGVLLSQPGLASKASRSGSHFAMA